MRRLTITIFLFLATQIAYAGLSTKVGVISYWGTTTALYDQIPEGAIALINPDNGIFVSAGQTQTLVPNLVQFRQIVKRESRRDVRMLGYVPTGYFNHTCNAIGQCQTLARIDAQVQAYFAQMPDLEGIFFDEVAPSAWSCAAFPAEYQALRDIVHKYSRHALIAFNAGVPDNCAVSGANAGEILVLFENTESAYFAQAQNISVSTMTALNKGVIPWHLIDTVPGVADLNTVVTQAQSDYAGLLYVTNIGGDWQAGDNTWGSLPTFWTQEVALLNGAANRKIPSCASLVANSAGQLVDKVKLHDIGQLGYVYLGTIDSSGKRWFFDGLHWNAETGGNRSVFTSQTLTGLLTLSNQAVANMVASLPAKASRIWMAYAVAEEPNDLKAQMAVCK